MTDSDEAVVTAAQEHPDRAAAVAAKLKPGTHEAVQALALVSIAKSLTVLARRALTS